MFEALGAGRNGLRLKSASGAGEDVTLLAAEALDIPIPHDWSRDGRFIVYERSVGANGADLFVLPMTEKAEAGKPAPLIQGPGQQNRAAFAPDGRWIAYNSDESGLVQIYVRPFPVTGGQFQVSRNGGTQPQWRGDGQEIFFLSLDGSVMAAPVDTTRDFQVGVPQALFTAANVFASARRQYAVTRDGQRFLVLNPERGPTGSALTVVVNWLASVHK